MRRSAVALALILSIAPVFSTLSAAAQTDQAVAQARFNKGRDLFMAGSYAEAVVELRAATNLFESPNTRLYIARCEKELGHLARAYVEFRRAGTEASDRAATDPRYAATADAAKQEGAAIAAQLGHLVIDGKGVPTNLALTVAGSTMSASALGVAAPVDPGPVVVSATARGFKPFERSVEVAAGQEVHVALSLERDSAAGGGEPVGDGDESGRRVGGGARMAGYVVGGAGLVGMVFFAAFAGVAQSRFNQLQSECGNHCGPSYQASIDEGKRYQTIGNVSLAAGATLLVTGIVMIAVGGPKTVSSAPKPESAAFAPLFGPSQGGRGFAFGASGAF